MVVTILAIMLRLHPRWLPMPRPFTLVRVIPGLAVIGIQQDRDTPGGPVIGLDLHMLAQYGLDPATTVADIIAATGAANWLGLYCPSVDGPLNAQVCNQVPVVRRIVHW